MITRQYLKDISKNDDENDDRNYTLVEGKKVPNHGHWEYLDDNGHIGSKGTFMDGYHEGVWQTFHSNGSIAARIFYHKGRFFFEAQFYDPEYNNIDEIEDEELKRDVQNYIHFSSLRLALDVAIKKPDEYIKPFCFYEIYNLVLRKEKSDDYCVRHHFNKGGNKILAELIKEEAKFWHENIYDHRPGSEFITSVLICMTNTKNYEGLQKLFVSLK
tara:strand:- start:92 stop:736 length:645 start_codon:yes stop_codon:yes gene_type:complete